jgi:hypothetical protein
MFLPNNGRCAQACTGPLTAVAANVANSTPELSPPGAQQESIVAGRQPYYEFFHLSLIRIVCLPA